MSPPSYNISHCTVCNNNANPTTNAQNRHQLQIHYSTTNMWENILVAEATNNIRQGVLIFACFKCMVGLLQRCRMLCCMLHSVHILLRSGSTHRRRMLRMRASREHSDMKDIMYASQALLAH